jgi:hypothetical protein
VAPDASAAPVEPDVIDLTFDSPLLTTKKYRPDTPDPFRKAGLKTT